MGAGTVKTESSGRPAQEPLDLFSKVNIYAMSRLVTESESGVTGDPSLLSCLFDALMFAASHSDELIY